MDSGLLGTPTVPDPGDIARKPTGVSFSVVIPVYNQERLIARSLHSVLAQTCPATEIIVVDDGSTDGTGRTVADIAARNRQVRYIRQENAGVSAARNAGLRASSGDWVAILDADDFWRPTLLAHAMEQITALPDVQFIHVRRSNLFPDGSTNAGPEVTAAQMVDRSFLLSCFAIRTCGAMVRRDLLTSMETWFPAHLRTCEDFHFFGRVVMSARNVAFIDSHDAVISMEANSLSRGTDSAALLRDSIDAMRELIVWAGARGVDARWRASLEAHQYWRLRELMLVALWRRDLATLGDAVASALREQGPLRALRAACSAALARLRGQS